jgi:hypothetical protein
MKRNVKDCRHNHAYPTMVKLFGGFLWCPDCGAHRLIVTCGTNGYYPASKRWIYPTGYQDVLKQLELQEKDK